MKKTLDLKLNDLQELGKEELKSVAGGFLPALALGLAGIAFAYNVGKDVAKWVKAQEQLNS